MDFSQNKTVPVRTYVISKPMLMALLVLLALLCVAGDDE